MPQVIIEKLAEYRQTHQLQSISQAIAAALSEFFGVEGVRLNLISTNNSITYHRIEELETIVDCLVQRLATLEQKHTVVLQLTKRDSAASLIESSQPLKESSSASSPQCVEEESGSRSNSDIDTIYTRNTSTRSQTASTPNSSNRESAVLSLEEWKTGVTTNTLVARLRTNPTTLRKYTYGSPIFE